MAITFEEEKPKPYKPILIGLAVVAIIAGGGYFGYNFLTKNAPTAVQEVPQGIELNKAILADPRLDSLELMPAVAPLAETPGRDNPFTPYQAQPSAPNAQSAPAAQQNNAAAAPAAQTPGQ